MLNQGRWPWPYPTLVSSPPLALAVLGRGVVDPSEPLILADDGRCCAAGQRSRRCASTAARRFGWTTIWSGSRTPPRSCDCRRPTPPGCPSWRSAAVAASGVPDAALRVVWTPGRDDGDPVGFALVTAISDGLEQERAAGMRLVSLQLAIGAIVRQHSPVAPAGGQVDQLCGQHRRPGGGPPARRRRRGVPVARGDRAGGADLERVDARAGDAADAVTRPRHPGRRYPRHPDGRRGRRRDPGGRGVVPADAAGGRPGGVHLLQRARGDAGDRSRRRADRRRPARDRWRPACRLPCAPQPASDQSARAPSPARGARRPRTRAEAGG